MARGKLLILQCKIEGATIKDTPSNSPNPLLIKKKLQ
jgi:hypothetical protein